MIKLFHYDIYEYQLLQNELDKLSMQGYTTDKISYITKFKKTNKPVYYLVDIYTSDKKNDNIRSYVKYYLDNHYELISNFNNLLVFKGFKKLEPRPLKQEIAQVEKSKRLFHLLLAILFLFLIYMFIINPLKSYHLLTNGNILYYLAIIFIPISILYRTFLRWSGIYQLSKSIKQKKSFELKNSILYYYASTLLPISIIILLLISPLIDILNTKQLTNIPETLVTLQDLNVEKESDYSIYSRTSLVVPKSYEYVEITKDNQEEMIVNQYHLHNSNSAKILLEDLINNPELLYVDVIKEIGNNEYLGYFENKAYIKIIINENILTLINTSFEIK